MSTYVVLGKLTQKGIQDAKEIPKRRDARMQGAEALGIKIRENFLTMGSYDVVMVLDAPNSEALATFVLQIGMRGHVTTETLRAFNDDEVERVVGSL